MCKGNDRGCASRKDMKTEQIPIAFTYFSPALPRETYNGHCKHTGSEHTGQY